MGGCATKPKDLNADGDVPRPIDAPDPHPEDAGEKKDVVPVEETKEVAGPVLDDNRRRSLGTLFQEVHFSNLIFDLLLYFFGIKIDRGSI